MKSALKRSSEEDATSAPNKRPCLLLKEDIVLVDYQVRLIEKISSLLNSASITVCGAEFPLPKSVNIAVSAGVGVKTSLAAYAKDKKCVVFTYKIDAWKSACGDQAFIISEAIFAENDDGDERNVLAWLSSICTNFKTIIVEVKLAQLLSSFEGAFVSMTHAHKIDTIILDKPVNIIHCNFSECKFTEVINVTCTEPVPLVIPKLANPAAPVCYDMLDKFITRRMTITNEDIGLSRRVKFGKITTCPHPAPCYNDDQNMSNLVGIFSLVLKNIDLPEQSEHETEETGKNEDADDIICAICSRHIQTKFTFSSCCKKSVCAHCVPTLYKHKKTASLTCPFCRKEVHVKVVEATIERLCNVERKRFKDTVLRGRIMLVSKELFKKNELVEKLVKRDKKFSVVEDGGTGPGATGVIFKRSYSDDTFERMDAVIREITHVDTLIIDKDVSADLIEEIFNTIRRPWAKCKTINLVLGMPFVDCAQMLMGF